MHANNQRLVPHWAYAAEQFDLLTRNGRVTLSVLDGEGGTIELFDMFAPEQNVATLTTQHINKYISGEVLPLTRREILEHIHHNVVHQLAVLSLEGK